jgi:hypothetical protein
MYNMGTGLNKCQAAESPDRVGLTLPKVLSLFNRLLWVRGA